jgi:hypothetical protein
LRVGDVDVKQQQDRHNETIERGHGPLREHAVCQRTPWDGPLKPRDRCRSQPAYGKCTVFGGGQQVSTI